MVVRKFYYFILVLSVYSLGRRNRVILFRAELKFCRTGARSISPCESFQLLPNYQAKRAYSSPLSSAGSYVNYNLQGFLWSIL